MPADVAALAAIQVFIQALGFDGPVGLQCYAIKGDVRENLKRSKQAWDKLQ